MGYELWEGETGWIEETGNVFTDLSSLTSHNRQTEVDEIRPIQQMRKPKWNNLTSKWLEENKTKEEWRVSWRTKPSRAGVHLVHVCSTATSHAQGLRTTRILLLPLSSALRCWLHFPFFQTKTDASYWGLAMCQALSHIPSLQPPSHPMSGQYYCYFTDKENWDWEGRLRTLLQDTHLDTLGWDCSVNPGLPYSRASLLTWFLAGLAFIQPSSPDEPLVAPSLCSLSTEISV